VKRVVRPLAILLAVLVGCDTSGWGRRQHLPPEPAPKPRLQTNNPLVTGTIGEQTLLTGENVQVLRGFGLVIGLNGKGSRDCPTVVREYLLEFLTKQIAPQGSGERRARLSPAQLIDSADTAVVEVMGAVPAGALVGIRFDLQVQTLPGTSTESLGGGLLLPTQLRLFEPAASGLGLLQSAVLAEGGGPVFINPFADSSSGTSDADPRRGLVLGGGRAGAPRSARLTLLQPNYSLARAVERRINERFGQNPSAASALSKGYVVLETPPGYAHQSDLFRRLVAHLYLDKNPAAQERTLRELSRLAVGPAPNYEHFALAWEGIGRGVIPYVQPFYTHTNPMLRFYAAQPGPRGDLLALPVVAQTAASGPHSLRLLAIRELGDAQSPQAALKLAPLLNERDREVRIAAYEALLLHGHPAIQSTRFPLILDRGQLNFSLDMIDSDGPPLIYVRRTRLPRIAVFGRQMALMPPVFYTHAEDSLTVHTVDGSDDVRMFMVRGGRLSEPVVVPPRVVDVITALAQLPIKDESGQLLGLGLPYSRVVQVLADLRESETISATLVFEQTSLTDLLGPARVPERPEGDREPDTWPEPDTQPDAERENADERTNVN
ncbi:MAG: flagellar basal body P-ring protein FlgI, partial [Phycisphaerae bacterium]|nr:flagellar basal body P-ring protein FlgI [Phycisphaerae bacterium]